MQTSIQLRPYGYIYKLTCKTTNKVYIGQTTKIPEERWKYYKTLRCRRQYKLYSALQKYGPDDFIYETVIMGADKTNLDLLEDMYIIYYNSIENGYNIKRGGSNGKHTPETIAKISSALKGKKKYPFSFTHKQNISAALKGRHVGGGIIGSKRSHETRLKMSNAKKNIIFSDKHIQNLKISRNSEKTKNKLAQYQGSMLGKHHSEITKLKMSLAQKSRRISEAKIKIS